MTYHFLISLRFHHPSTNLPPRFLVEGWWKAFCRNLLKNKASTKNSTMKSVGGSWWKAMGRNPLSRKTLRSFHQPFHQPSTNFLPPPIYLRYIPPGRRAAPRLVAGRALALCRRQGSNSEILMPMAKLPRASRCRIGGLLVCRGGRCDGACRYCGRKRNGGRWIG